MHYLWYLVGCVKEVILSMRVWQVMQSQFTEVFGPVRSMQSKRACTYPYPITSTRVCTYVRGVSAGVVDSLSRCVCVCLSARVVECIVLGYAHLRTHHMNFAWYNCTHACIFLCFCVFSCAGPEADPVFGVLSAMCSRMGALLSDDAHSEGTFPALPPRPVLQLSQAAVGMVCACVRLCGFFAIWVCACV